MFYCTSLHQASGSERLQREAGKEPWSPHAATRALLCGAFRSSLCREFSVPSQNSSAALSQLMAARFSALIETVCAMRRPTALAQIAGRLALMDEKCKDCDSAVTRSVLQMSQSDLADMTGHARQTINAAVNRLEDEGLIRVGHRQMRSSIQKVSTLTSPVRSLRLAMALSLSRMSGSGPLAASCISGRF